MGKEEIFYFFKTVSEMTLSLIVLRTILNPNTCASTLQTGSVNHCTIKHTTNKRGGQRGIDQRHNVIIAKTHKRVDASSFKLVSFLSSSRQFRVELQANFCGGARVLIALDYT